MELALDQRFVVHKQILVEQLFVETLDGFLARSPKNDINIQYKDTFHSQKPRSDPAEPFARLTFELSDSIQHVKRVYPTVIDFLSDFGGIAEVVAFVVYLVITNHHHIHMQQFLINDAVLQNSNSLSLESQKSEILQSSVSVIQKSISLVEIPNYSYSEVVRFEYGCFRKGNQRAKKYRELMKIVAERMDVCNVVTNAGYMNVLSNLLLEPYQMKIITQYKTRATQTKTEAKDLTLNQAVS